MDVYETIKLIKEECENNDCITCHFFDKTFGCVFHNQPFRWRVKDIEDAVKVSKESKQNE